MKRNMAKRIEKPIGEIVYTSNTGILAPVLEQAKSFYSVPTSPATNSVLKVLNSGKDNLSSMKNKAKTVSHSQQIEVLQNGEKRLITISSSNSTVTLEIADIEKLTGSNKTAKKLFIFNLIKMNEQAYSGGVLKRNYMQFPLQELQDIGFYNTPQSARKGFNSGMDILTSLKIKGSMKQDKREVATALEVLFTGANIKNGVCTVFINERVNWEFIASFYTILPQYSFKLSNRAFDLILYIFYLARQNIKQIEEKGYFNVSLRAIQNQLQLPSEVGLNNPQRDIKEPIEKSIEEIMQHSNRTEFNIELVVDNNLPVTAYLDKGYIKISLKGIYAKEFIDLSKRKTNQISTAQKRRDSITERAIAINTAKKLKSKETSPNKDSSKKNNDIQDGSF